MRFNHSADVHLHRACCLRLRSDLAITPQFTRGKVAYYIVEDRSAEKYYRLGIVEAHFARFLNGSTTIEHALEKLSSSFAMHRFTESDAIVLCRWLVEQGLARTQNVPYSDGSEYPVEHIESPQAISVWNPLSFRLRLWNPDRFLGWWLPSIKWSFTTWAVVAWGILVGLGGCAIAWNWPRFCDASPPVFVVANGWWMVGCWLGLKLIHEAAHGFACKRFGGRVRQAGIQTVWLMPIPFVDVTSSRQFTSRRRRVIVALAGTYAEIAIASLAAIYWASSEAGWLNHLAYNVIVMVSITFLINANPLMKLDGYNIWCDLTAIPKLHHHGHRGAQDLIGHQGMGPPTTEHACLIVLYGWSLLACRMVISLIIATGLAAWLPWPVDLRVPAVVEYASPMIVRAANRGHVAAVHIENGQYVDQGTLLLTLENRDLVAKIEMLKLQIEQTAILEQRRQQPSPSALSQTEAENRQNLEAELAEKMRELDELLIRAPRAGFVDHPNLSSLRGRYLKAGEQVLRIASNSQKELRVAIPQNDLGKFSSCLGTPVKIDIAGMPRSVGLISQIIPRASPASIDPALISVGGGSLPVRPSSMNNNDEAISIGRYELLEPELEAIVQLDPQMSYRLTAGQNATVIANHQHESVGEHIWKRLSTWLRSFKEDVGILSLSTAREL